MGVQQLAAFNFGALWQSITRFFTGFSIMYAIEIAFFFLVIYFVSKVLRDNDATKLMILYWIALLAGGCMHIFDSEVMTKQFFLFYVILISGIMLLLFSVEVKKYFWDVHTSREKGMEKSATPVYSQAETERCINYIVKALQNMSKKNVGALIVLSRGSLPKQVLQSGVSIDAEISPQLIEGVFFPKAPLHDGAMVIEGNKIQSAGVLLPLTEDPKLSWKYGTRHRAALGMSEVSDAACLVVSEETGDVSICMDGMLKKYEDLTTLKSDLESILGIKPIEVEEKHKNIFDRLRGK